MREGETEEGKEGSAGIMYSTGNETEMASLPKMLETGNWKVCPSRIFDLKRN